MTTEAIGVALVGAGNHAAAWCEAYRRLPNVHLVGVYDDNSSQALALQRAFPELTVFVSLGDVLSNSEVWIAEINTPVLESMEAAERCLEAGVSIGLRTTAAADPQALAAVLDKREKKVAVRAFSHAFYAPQMEEALGLIEDEALGDLQTLRVRSVVGRHGRADHPRLRWPISAAPVLCGPEFDALPLMALLGDVQAVHARQNDRVTLVRWRSGKGRGAERYGVYEAVRGTENVIRGPLEPMDVSFELAGTDGYLFVAGLVGKERERPPLSMYVRDGLRIPSTRIDDDPMTAYHSAASDLVRAARYRAKPEYAEDRLARVAACREAIRESLRTGEEAVPAI